MTMADADQVAALATRIKRGILTLGSLPDREAGYRNSSGTAWPEIVQLAIDAYASAPASARFVPSAADVDDWEPCLRMLAWLKRQNDGHRDYIVIVGRAYDIPWYRLADRFGRSDKQVKRWYDGAITRIWCNFYDTPQNLVA